MALTDSETEREPTQQGADIESIHEIVADVEQMLRAHGEHLLRHDARFDHTDETLVEVRHRLPA